VRTWPVFGLLARQQRTIFIERKRSEAKRQREELERRIRGRGTEREEAIQRRLGRAHQELEAEAEFDAVLVNGDLEQAISNLEELLNLG
jgi:guanylate kinase